MTTATPAATEDNFDSAFRQLAALGDKPVTDEAMKPPVKETPDPAAAAAAETEAAAAAAAAETTDTTGADDGAEDGDLPSPEAAIAEKEAADAAAAQAAADKGTPPALEAVLDRLAERLAPPKPAAQEVQPPPEEPIYTKEELQFLSGYRKDYPDIAQAESMIRQAEYRTLAGYFFGEVQKVLAPMQHLLGQVATRTQLVDLQAAVPDYADARDKVIAWVEEQPDYLQAGMKHVIENGTVDQIKDLIGRYQKDVGAPAPVEQPATTGQENGSELPTAAKQAAERLAPVGSKRSAVIAAPSKHDFDAAFAEAAKET